MLWGTATHKDRNQKLLDMDGNPISYEHSIFSKIRFVDKLPHKDGNFNNSFGAKHMKWDKGDCLYITNYQQNFNLFIAHLNKLSKYIHLDDERIMHFLVNKYTKGKGPDFFKTCVCIGIRRGEDFRGKNKITNFSINRAKNEHFPNHDVLVISDLKTIGKTVDGSEIEFPYDIVDEPDIVQLHLARLCPNLIVSESTFHVWMGYFIQETFAEHAKIVCFKNTDVTNHCLNPPSWIQMNYWKGSGGGDI